MGLHGSHVPRVSRLGSRPRDALEKAAFDQCAGALSQWSKEGNLSRRRFCRGMFFSTKRKRSTAIASRSKGFQGSFTFSNGRARVPSACWISYRWHGLSTKWLINGSSRLAYRHVRFGKKRYEIVRDAKWDEIETVEGVRVRDVVSNLLKQWLLETLVRRRLKRDTTTGLTYFPKGSFPKNKIKYQSRKGRKTWISVVGEKKFRGRLYRYHLAPDFQIRQYLGPDFGCPIENSLVPYRFERQASTDRDGHSASETCDVRLVQSAMVEPCLGSRFLFGPE